MPKNTLKMLVPSPARIREMKALSVLGDWIYASNLWHINRYSASMAFFVGFFVAFMPLPGQMVLAAVLAILLRCNLPLSVSLVWITNPVTMPAIFFLAYKVGALMVDVPVREIQFEMTFHWLTHRLTDIWKPFLLGCLLCGTFFGCLGYFVISQMWRWRVAYYWHRRRRERAARRSGMSE
ncbi:MAG: DUF2062 domain-containing protein [Halioglobus sp.]|nr:DUF2062 domain-containing protein [Halioglobus sp.]